MNKSTARKHFAFLEHLSMGQRAGIREREEVEEYLEDFLKANISLARIMSLLGDDGVFYNYDALKEHGAYINLTDIAKRLGGDFVYENIDDFLVRVSRVDIFLLEVYDHDSFCEICEKNSAEDFFFRLICHGVKARTIFCLADKFLREMVESPEDLFRLISFLIGYGLNKKSASDWLTARLSENSFNFLAQADEYAEVLKNFGVRMHSLIRPYLDNYGEEHLRNLMIYPLPEWISMDALVKYFPMRKIIDDCGLEFIYEFENRGGSMNKLAQEFIRDIGYPENYEDAFFLLMIIENGGAHLVDVDWFAGHVDVSQLNDADKECFYDTLSTHGVEAEKLQRFK